MKSAPSVPPPQQDLPPPEGTGEIRFHYADDSGATVGPCTVDQMRQLHRQGILHDQSWVIVEGCTDWRPFAESVPPAPTPRSIAPAQGFSKHAFISHSSRDHDLAVRICEILEDHGLHCWIAPRDIAPGAPYDEEILRGIACSQTFILLLSDHSNESPHVKRELMCALRAGHAIYPIRIQEIQPGPKLEYLLEGIHWVDAWTPPLEAHLDRLSQLIADSDPAAATSHHAGKRKRLGKRALWKPRSRRGQWITTMAVLALLVTGGWWIADQVKKGAVSNLLSSFAQNVAERVGNMLSFSKSEKSEATPPTPETAAPQPVPTAAPPAAARTAARVATAPSQPPDPNAKVDCSVKLSWAREASTPKTAPSHAQITDVNGDVVGEVALIDQHTESEFVFIDPQKQQHTLSKFRYDDSVGHVRLGKVQGLSVSGRVIDVKPHGEGQSSWDCWIEILTVEVTVKR